jgi:hypothetical protein
MADNTPFTADPTQIIAADDIGGVKHQRVKVEFGVDGSATDVSSVTPMPASVVPGRGATTYTAVYRLATVTANPALSFAFTANTDKQWATIYHTAGSAKTARLRRVGLTLTTTAATVLTAEIRRLSAATAPATGNPAITPIAHDSSSAAAEAACLALPTTAGSDAAANSPFVSKNLNLLAAATATNQPFAGDVEMTLFDELHQGTDAQTLIMRAGVAEGYAVILRSTAAVTLTGTVRVVFTEA